MQNAEELLEDAAVLNAIDGIAKEDLLFGVRRAEEPNKPNDVAWSIDLLHTAQKTGRRVLVVEYLKDPVKMMAAATRILEEGFVPYFAPRRLNCLNPPAVLGPNGQPPRPSLSLRALYLPSKLRQRRTWHAAPNRALSANQT